MTFEHVGLVSSMDFERRTPMNFLKEWMRFGSPARPYRTSRNLLRYREPCSFGQELNKMGHHTSLAAAATLADPSLTFSAYESTE